MREAALVAVLTRSPSSAEVSSFPAAVRWLEVRADRAGDPDADRLRCDFPGTLLYSLRSRAEGGAFAGSDTERRARLLAASRRWDLVELETGDLVPEILDRIPAERRVLSWHGAAPGSTLNELRARLARFAAVGARLIRLVPAAGEPADALAPLRLLREAGRSDLTAWASGPAGSWSRLLAPRLGAPLVFAAVGEGEGEPSVAQLIADYGLPHMPPIEDIYGIVGRTAAKSLSPRLHNAAYRVLGLPALYLSFPTERFGAFWDALGDGALAGLGWPLRGLTVTSPHKESALAAAEEASPLARQAGGANTLLRKDVVWRADTADADGVLCALGARGIAVAGRRVAVVGCGGAGRAAAAGLQAAGADVTLVNRGSERGHFAAALLGLPFVPLARFSARDLALVVHATPLQHETPFPVDGLDGGAVVVELVYGPTPTPLMTAAAARGCLAIDGREVLLVEAQRQFQMMTGRQMPQDLVHLVRPDGPGACAGIPARVSFDPLSGCTAAFA
ncbi:MAG TPA: type I 3-dehydroquinate dehydratase [Thermoanaerobaculia bacterium]|nr:type I 3-dehydroquinate dehydratase [Thermoanaerobaculia bacterium]